MNSLPISIIKKIYWYLDSTSYKNILRTCKRLNSAKIHINLSNHEIFISPDIKYIYAPSRLIDFIGFNGNENLVTNSISFGEIAKDLNCVKFDENTNMAEGDKYLIIDSIYANSIICYGLNLLYYGNTNNLYCTSVKLRNNLNYLECNNLKFESGTKINILKIIYNSQKEISIPIVNELILYGFEEKIKIFGIWNIEKKITFEKCSSEFIHKNISELIKKMITIVII